MFEWLKEILDLRIEYRSKKLELDYKVLNIKSADNEIQLGKEQTYDICQSCETLKQQLAIANQEKKDLLNRILKEPEVKTQTIIQNPRAVIPARHLGFEARRRMLEAESKANARLLDEKRREDSNLKVVTKVDEETRTVEIANVADLEAELDIVAAERESKMS